MTDCSADAIIPNDGLTRRSRVRRSVSLNSRRSRAFSIPEEGDTWSGDEDDLLDSYFFESFPMPLPLLAPMPFEPDAPLAKFAPDSARSTPSDRGSSPIHTNGRLAPSSSSPPTKTLPSFFEGRAPTPLSDRPSTPLSVSTPTSATFSMISTAPSTTSSAPPGSTLNVKVALGDSIIMLRVPRDISLQDMRQRIHDKFVKQEEVPLSDTFRFACIHPTSSSNMAPVPTGRKRSGSLSSVATFDLTKMRFITTQTEWDQVTATANPAEKLALRILDTMM
jgi:hypothetical protein